jgi:peptide/nickel transport system substrate-binding protein
LIATATYGSELSPEVQFLRDFRDYKILRTQAGSNFMIAFNAWYYSFSPTVAHLIAAHQSIRATMKVVLYPLIGILKLGALTFDLAPLNPELRAIISGLLVSTLIGVSYAALPFAMLTMTLPRVRKYCKSSIMVSYIVALGALTFIAFAEFTNSSTLMILSTATLVLTTLIGSTLLTSEYISKGLDRLKSSV